MKQFLRELPAISFVKNDYRFLQSCENFRLSEQELTKIIQSELDHFRTELLSNTFSQLRTPNKKEFTDLLFMRLQHKLTTYEPFNLRRVINATGTILHTNLGRAKLSEAAISQVVETARNYSNLEYQIETGQRGSRHDIIDDTLQRITGAEAAMVVNNNAAAVYLILRALAKDQEVIVSRGQLVEIGGSFRISAIMEESGARLKEVGTTNKTHLSDYETAISEHTAMILKVHTSNFKTVGFTATVETEQLVKLKENNQYLIFYEDLGSGAFFDFHQHGIEEESVVAKVVKMGVDLVSFSGDKLLGGPQAGIIVGKKALIQKLKKHQLARVLRVDKMTLAALEATLKAYENETAITEIPTVKDMLLSKHEVEKKANVFIEELKRSCSIFTCQLVDETSQIGGGTMPTVEVATKAVGIETEFLSANTLAEKLRFYKPAIITRCKDNQVLLDFRTITTEELLIVVEALITIEQSIRRES